MPESAYRQIPNKVIAVLTLVTLGVCGVVYVVSRSVPDPWGIEAAAYQRALREVQDVYAGRIKFDDVASARAFYDDHLQLIGETFEDWFQPWMLNP